MSNPAGNDALDYRVKIIVEGKNQALVDQAAAEIDKIV
jgi:ribosomal protein L6P/L9E